MSPASISVLRCGRGLRINKKLTAEQIAAAARALAADRPSKPAPILAFRVGGVLVGDFTSMPPLPTDPVLLIAVHADRAAQTIDLFKCGCKEWQVVSAGATVIDNGNHYAVAPREYNPATAAGTPVPDVCEHIKSLRRWGLRTSRLFVLPFPRRFFAAEWTPLADISFPSAAFIDFPPGRVCTNPPKNDEKTWMFDPRKTPNDANEERDDTSRDVLIEHARKTGMMLFSRAIGGKRPKEDRRKNKFFIARLYGVLDILANPYTKGFSVFHRDRKEFEYLHLMLDEKLLPERPTKPFMDIEGDYDKNDVWRETRDDLTLLAVDVMIAHMHEFFPKMHLSRRDVLILSNDAVEKFSRHAIVPCWMVATSFLLKCVMDRLLERLVFCYRTPERCVAEMCRKNHVGKQLFSHEKNGEIKFVIDFSPYGKSLRPGGCAKVPDVAFGPMRILEPAGINAFRNVAPGASAFQVSLLQYPFGNAYVEERIVDVAARPGDTLFGKPVAVDLFGHLVRRKYAKTGGKRARGRSHAATELSAKLAKTDWAAPWSFHGSRLAAKQSGYYLNVADEGDGRFCPFINDMHGGATVDLAFRQQADKTFRASIKCHGCNKTMEVARGLGQEWADVIL